MKILSLGSLNFDLVYRVPHVNLEGETIAARNFDEKIGGKGLNQSIALARAGADVAMAGCVGEDGAPLIETLRAAGVNADLIRTVNGRSGHAIIQLADSGANAIVIYGGANDRITPTMIDETLAHFSAGDWLLLQNETANVDYAIRAAKAHGMKVALNPSPISDALLRYPLELVDLFILNEIEGQTLAGVTQNDGRAILASLADRFPAAAIVLTLGERGALYHDESTDLFCPAFDAPVVDTTAAGDTFCGFFLSGTIRGMSPADALTMASRASALAIGTLGAAVSIPTWEAAERTAFRAKPYC